MSGFGHGFRRSGQRREEDQHDFTQATLPGKQPVITSILRDFSAEALSELRQWLEANPPAIPIYQLPGFALTVPQRATVATLESTTSLAFTDLPTPGPTISGLADGKYLVMVSALMFSSGAGVASLIAPSANGAVPTDDIAAIWAISSAVGYGTPAGFAVLTLNAGGNNSIKAKYRVNTTGTANFQYRNLVAIRLANL